MICWNVSAIVEAAGGAANLRRLLARADQEVPDNAAISMWKSRNRIPSQWSAPILWVLLHNNSNVVVTDLMVVVATADDSLFASEDTQ